MRWPNALLTLAYCGGIWWLSSQSNPPHLPYEIPNIDKVAHFILYAGLASTVYGGLMRSKPAADPRMLLYAPVVVAAAYGVVDEIHQAFVPLRSCSFGDLLADVSGATLFQVAATGSLGARFFGKHPHHTEPCKKVLATDSTDNTH